MKNILVLFLALITSLVFGQPYPNLENVSVELKPGNIMTITFDLLYPTNDLAEVTFRATKRGGLLFDYDTDNATGHVGVGLAGGTGLQIDWDYSAYDTISEFRLMLVAKLNQSVDIQALVDQVDSSRLSADLTFLEGFRHRNTGAAHLEEVRDFINAQFLDAELETSVLDVPDGNYTGKNIVGRMIGTNNEELVYILDGHYDSIDDSPGADDNASAIAGMLEALRILSPYSFKKTIRFIGFDLEEAGLVGSADYVANSISPLESIEGVLNFEMIGYYSDEPDTQDTPVGFSLLFPEAYAALEANDFKGDFINLVGNSDALGLMEAYETAAVTYVPDLNVLLMEVPSNWPIVAFDLGRSDHAPFWLAGHPAIMFTDGANFRNPYYHTPQDTKDKLDFNFMRQVVQASVATLAEVAEIQMADTWWTDTNFTTSTSEIDGCEFHLSPNPAHDLLRLEWADCQLGRIEIELLDIQGRTVKRQVHQQQNGFTTAIDVRGLEKGVYFLKVKNEDGQWAQKVVVD